MIAVDKEENRKKPERQAGREGGMLCRGAMGVSQHPTESFATSNPAETPPDAFRLDDRVGGPLVIPLRG